MEKKKGKEERKMKWYERLFIGLSMGMMFACLIAFVILAFVVIGHDGIVQIDLSMFHELHIELLFGLLAICYIPYWFRVAVNLSMAGEKQ